MEGGYLVFHDLWDLNIFCRVDLIEDWTEVVTCNLGVAALGYIFYEFHDFYAKAVGFYPHSEFVVFGFDSFYQG